MKEQEIEDLLKAAAPLPQPDPQMMNEIKVATEQSWMDVVARRKANSRRRTYIGLLATAAVLILAVSLQVTINSTPRSLETEQIALVMKLNGNISINGQHYSKDQPIKVGDSINTNENSQLTIKLKDNTTVTFSSNTQITLANHNTLNLDRGRIYISSSNIDTQVTIVTPWGNIKDIGTQYEIDMSDQVLKVSMRTGKVAMELDNGLVYAETDNGYGDVVIVERSKPVIKQTIAATDNHWSWTHETIADINIDGLSVYDLMVWTTEITGKKVIYMNQDVEQAAKATRLSGGLISPMFLEKTLPLILKTSKLSANITDTEITLNLAPKD